MALFKKIFSKSKSEDISSLQKKHSLSTKEKSLKRSHSSGAIVRSDTLVNDGCKPFALNASASNIGAPVSVEAPLQKWHINKLPYDILGKILEMVHENRITTKLFVEIGLVCKHWRVLARVNGQSINLESFFNYATFSKLKPQVIEHYVKYFSIVYYSFDELELGYQAVNNSHNLKYLTMLLDEMEKFSRIQIDMDQIKMPEFELFSSAILQTRKPIRMLEFMNISGGQISGICDLIGRLYTLESVSFYNCKFGNDSKPYEAMVSMMEHNSVKSIEHVKITYQICENQMMDVVKAMLASLPKLKSFYLQSLNRDVSLISKEAYGVFKQTRFSKILSKELSSFSMIDCHLLSKDLDELSGLLASLEGLHSLDISGSNLLDPLFIESFIRTVLVSSANSKSVESLNFSKLPINHACIVTLSEFLSGPTCRLEVLNLNQISDPLTNPSFQLLSESIGANKSLLVLNISHLKFQASPTDLAQLFSQSLAKSRIHTLDISFTFSNYISCTQVLLQSLSSNSSLLHLDCSSNPFPLETSIFNFLCKSKTLQMNLNNCNISDQQLHKLTETLVHNPHHLLELNLSNNPHFTSDSLNHLNSNLLIKPNLHIKHIYISKPLKLKEQSSKLINIKQ